MTKITLLDGGMGQELIRRASGPPTPLWSAQVMMDEPDLVRDVHLDNIRAGARVITLNTYSVTRTRLEPHGLAEQFKVLQRRAIDLAQAARDASGEEVAIAGCLPPYLWSYRPEMNPGAAEMIPHYNEIASLQAPHVDLLLCETMGSAEEAFAAVSAAAATGKPVWVSWTLADDGTGRLRSGETLAEANAALDGLPVAARLVNCSKPETVDLAFDDLKALGGTVGAYANGFTGIRDYFTAGSTVAGLSARADLGPEQYADFAMGWVDRGAKIIGGCCEVGPEHIAELARRLAEAGHEIVGA
ncbi:MAG: homocysteine S-methyltransferase family protein [Paracoccaceae bacterium]|nr:homocysteine S-methyltransferase family protein [Paracoccaceae bacterium]